MHYPLKSLRARAIVITVIASVRAQRCPDRQPPWPTLRHLSVPGQPARRRAQQWVKMAGDCLTQTEEEEAAGSSETASCVEDAAVGVWQAVLWLRCVFARLWEGGGIASLASFLWGSLCGHAANRTSVSWLAGYEEETFLFGDRDGGVAPQATGCSSYNSSGYRKHMIRTANSCASW